MPVKDSCTTFVISFFCPPVIVISPCITAPSPTSILGASIFPKTLPVSINITSFSAAILPIKVPAIVILSVIIVLVFTLPLGPIIKCPSIFNSPSNFPSI